MQVFVMQSSLCFTDVRNHSPNNCNKRRSNDRKSEEFQRTVKFFSPYLFLLPSEVLPYWRKKKTKLNKGEIIQEMNRYRKEACIIFTLSSSLFAKAFSSLPLLVR